MISDELKPGRSLTLADPTNAIADPCLERAQAELWWSLLLLSRSAAENWTLRWSNQNKRQAASPTGSWVIRPP